MRRQARRATAPWLPEALTLCKELMFLVVLLFLAKLGLKQRNFALIKRQVFKYSCIETKNRLQVSLPAC